MRTLAKGLSYVSLICCSVAIIKVFEQCPLFWSSVVMCFTLGPWAGILIIWMKLKGEQQSVVILRDNYARASRDNEENYKAAIRYQGLLHLQKAETCRYKKLCRRLRRRLWRGWE